MYTNRYQAVGARLRKGVMIFGPPGKIKKWYSDYLLAIGTKMNK